MFFSISTEKFDDRFFEHIKVFDYYISLDSGWHHATVNNTEVFYKGYCDTESMLDIVDEFVNDPVPRYRGNFGIIIVQNNRLTVTHDISRAFPLNIDNLGFLTNLTMLNSREPVWADRYVVYNGTEIEYEFFDPCAGLNYSFDEKLSLQSCASEIKRILDEKVQYLHTTDLPINLYLSGGLDTTLLYAYAKYHLDAENIEYNILNYEHYHYNKFLQKNHSNLKKEFAVYGFVHSFRDPCVLFSGAPGDESMFRGPHAASLWCAFKNIDLLQELKFGDYYHKKHFLTAETQNFINSNYNVRDQIQQQYPTYELLCRQLINIFVNDHQMWHLNETITWTPFKDPRILELVLRLNDDDLLMQILDGKLSKALVTMYDPVGLRILSDYKNHDSYSNFKNDPFLDKLFE